MSAVSNNQLQTTWQTASIKVCKRAGSAASRSAKVFTVFSLFVAGMIFWFLLPISMIAGSSAAFMAGVLAAAPKIAIVVGSVSAAIGILGEVFKDRIRIEGNFPDWE